MVYLKYLLLGLKHIESLQEIRVGAINDEIIENCILGSDNTIVKYNGMSDNIKHKFPKYYCHQKVKIIYDPNNRNSEFKISGVRLNKLLGKTPDIYKDDIDSVLFANILVREKFVELLYIYKEMATNA